MPRPRTGYVEPRRRSNGALYFVARIRLADGSRERVNVPEAYCAPAGGMTARDRAELYAQARQEREDQTHDLLRDRERRKAELAKQHDEHHGETCTRYFGRFLRHREEIGKVRRGRDLQSCWDVWIAPRIGSKPIAEVTRDDVEDVRDALDRAVAQRKKEGALVGLSGARARNVWSVLTSMMKEACTSKRRDLRVRADNPCSTVQPPDRTDPKKKTFVYPAEFLKLVSCRKVPREWRELYAVACYLYLRPGELRALLWTDVDFEAGVVHVTKAYDEDSKSLKPPKTRNGVRDVPIPAALVPLLRIMHKRSRGLGEVLPIMCGLNENRRSAWMRKHFELAKLDRPRLKEESATTMMVNFRSWRDTGITWLALDGVDVAKMQRRAGHDSISTTLGYVKMAEDLTGSIGEPFPALPATLLEGEDAPTIPPPRTRVRPNDRPKSPLKNYTSSKSLRKNVGEAGFEPATTSTQSSCTTRLCDSPGTHEFLAQASPSTTSSPRAPARLTESDGFRREQAMARRAEEPYSTYGDDARRRQRAAIGEKRQTPCRSAANARGSPRGLARSATYR
jgi:integrase